MKTTELTKNLSKVATLFLLTSSAPAAIQFTGGGGFNNPLILEITETIVFTTTTSLDAGNGVGFFTVIFRDVLEDAPENASNGPLGSLGATGAFDTTPTNGMVTTSGTFMDDFDFEGGFPMTITIGNSGRSNRSNIGGDPTNDLYLTFETFGGFSGGVGPTISSGQTVTINPGTFQIADDFSGFTTSGFGQNNFFSVRDDLPSSISVEIAGSIDDFGSQLGQIAGTQSVALSAVPEPSGILLISFGLLGSICRRRR